MPYKRVQHAQPGQVQPPASWRRVCTPCVRAMLLSASCWHIAHNESKVIAGPQLTSYSGKVPWKTRSPEAQGTNGRRGQHWVKRGRCHAREKACGCMFLCMFMPRR